MTDHAPLQPIEIMGQGTVEILLPLIDNFLEGTGYWATTEMSPSTGQHFQLLRVTGPLAGGVGDIGFIKVRQYQPEQVSVLFEWHSQPLAPADVLPAQQEYLKVVNWLTDQLTKLGFAPMAGDSTQPLPVVRPPDITGTVNPALA